MADNQYLNNFHKLGEQIFYDKPESNTTRKSEDPDIIVLFTWLYALPKHISKYTSQYRKLYPSVPILLLKQDGPDMIWRPHLFQMENLQTAVDVIQSLQKSQGKLSVLAHAWSNGGCYTATQFAEAYALYGPRAVNQEAKPPALPLSALIIDSAPSGVSMRSGFVALSQGLPASWPGPLKLFCGGFIWSTMSASALIGNLFGVEGTITGMRRKLNEPDGPFIHGGIPRMYIYSDTDELIPWRDVEEHAEQAQRALKNTVAGGVPIVRKEKFEGSKHVSHAVVDPERYWRIVQSFWDHSERK